MRMISLLILSLFIALPAQATETRKAMAQQDVIKQETIDLGNSRFLIFSGTANEHALYGYTVDLVKIENGIPHFDPLFIEDYNPETNQAVLGYGVAFMCLSYHFNKADNSMTYTMEDENKTRLQLKYKLDVDIFKLEQVDSQTPCAKEPCAPMPPKTIFKAATNAQTH